MHTAMKSIARAYYRRGRFDVNANEDNFLRLFVADVKPIQRTVLRLLAPI
jgi:hypothetical protein